jgi:hypothetical protein
MATRGVGVDPGKNFGFAVFYGPDQLSVFWGSFPDEENKWEYADWSYNFALDSSLGSGYPAAVEGAIFKAETQAGKPQVIFGEANLAYVRVGFALGFKHGEMDVKMVPPATARKAVFGSGTMRAREVWPLLTANAADAAALALYAAGFKHGADL